MRQTTHIQSYIQPFALSTRRQLGGEAVNSIFKILSMNRPGIKPKSRDNQAGVPNQYYIKTNRNLSQESSLQRRTTRQRPKASFGKCNVCTQRVSSQKYVS